MTHVSNSCHDAMDDYQLLAPKRLADCVVQGPGVGQHLFAAGFSRATTGAQGVSIFKVPVSAVVICVLEDVRVVQADGGVDRVLSAEDHISLFHQLIPRKQAPDGSVRVYDSTAQPFPRAHARAVVALDGKAQPERNPPQPRTAPVVEFKFVGAQPTPQLVDTALKDLAQRWLDAHPPPGAREAQPAAAAPRLVQIIPGGTHLHFIKAVNSGSPPVPAAPAPAAPPPPLPAAAAGPAGTAGAAGAAAPAAGIHVAPGGRRCSARLAAAASSSSSRAQATPFNSHITSSRGAAVRAGLQQSAAAAAAPPPAPLALLGAPAASAAAAETPGAGSLLAAAAGAGLVAAAGGAAGTGAAATGGLVTGAAGLAEDPQQHQQQQVAGDQDAAAAAADIAADVLKGYQVRGFMDLLLAHTQQNSAALPAPGEGLQALNGPSAAAAAAGATPAAAAATAAALAAPAVPAAAPLAAAPPQPDQQQQQPWVRTEPLSGATGMFPGLAEGSHADVEFTETCEFVRREVGTVQVRLYSGKGKGGQGAVFEGEVQPGYSYSSSGSSDPPPEGHHRLKALSAQQDPGQRRVAVKVLLRYSDLSEQAAQGWSAGGWSVLGKESFSTEVQAAQRCEAHDPKGYVLRVHAVGRVRVSPDLPGGEPDMRPALIIEYAAGGSVREQLQAHGGKLDWDPQQASQKTWVVAERMMMGLRVTNASLVLHCDCKPDNMFLIKEGDLSSAKLGDFGYSYLVYEAGDRGSTLVATPGYEAPETVDRLRHGTEMDVWLLGCSLLEMLTGRPPFYYVALAPPDVKKARRQGSELVREDSPYFDPTNPDYPQVGAHLTPTERDTLVKLLEVDSRKRLLMRLVWCLPYFFFGPSGKRS